MNFFHVKKKKKKKHFSTPVHKRRVTCFHQMACKDTLSTL